MITQFGSLFAGHVDLDNEGLDGTAANDRWLPDAELAGVFHPYYKAHRVITDDRRVTLARLGLCAAVGQVTRNGLGLLGVSAPESM